MGLFSRGGAETQRIPPPSPQGGLAQITVLSRRGTRLRPSGPAPGQRNSHLCSLCLIRKRWTVSSSFLLKVQSQNYRQSGDKPSYEIRRRCDRWWQRGICRGTNSSRPGCKGRHRGQGPAGRPVHPPGVYALQDPPEIIGHYVPDAQGQGVRTLCVRRQG